MAHRSWARALAVGGFALAVAALAAAVAAALAGRITFAAAVGSLTVTNGAMGLGFAACGVLLAWHRPRNPIGWLFLAAGVADVASASGAQLAMLGAGRGWDTAVLRALVSLLLGWPVAIGLFLPLALLLFPDGRPAGSRWRWSIWAAAAEGLLFALSYAGPGTLSFGHVAVTSYLTVPHYRRLARCGPPATSPGQRSSPSPSHRWWPGTAAAARPNAGSCSCRSHRRRSPTTSPRSSASCR